MLSAQTKRAGGFSLIELMVSMVIGLIVTGAVVAFIASMMRANTQTLSATRLNAELRTSAELVTRELRRAAYVVDPIEGIGTGCRTTTSGDTAIPLCPFMAVRDITINTDGDCLRFVYQVPDGSGGVITRFQAIRVANGALQMGVGSSAISCNQATTQVSSPLLNLTSASTFATSGRGVVVDMRGTLTGSSENQKTYRTLVAVRSGGV